MKAFVLLVAMSFALFGNSWAKLPAPTDGQKVAAEAAKEKAAEAAKKDAELLAKAQDRAADNYKKGKGRTAPAVAANSVAKK